MRLYPVFITVFILSLFVNACSDTGTLLPDLSSLDNDKALRFRLPQDGTVVENGRPFPVLINELIGSSPSSLSFFLIEPTGTNKTIKTINYPQSGTALEIELPTLADGRYKYRIVLKEENGQQTIVERTFIVLAKPVKINAISSYPSIALPNADLLLMARIEKKDAVDYYARWKIGEKLIQEGPLASFAAGLMLQAPERSGIHSATIELYPIFDEQSSIEYPAPVKHSFDIVVADRALAESSDLGPSKDFLVNVHFKGNLFAEHEIQMTPDASRFSGERILVADKDGYGYQLGSGNMAVLPFALLGNYTTESFSQVLVTKIKILQSSKGILISSRDTENNQSIKLALDELGHLQVEWMMGGDKLFSRSNSPVLVNMWQTIRIALVSNRDSRELFAYLEEQSFEATSRLAIDRKVLFGTNSNSRQPEDGVTRIGSIERPSFLIDELGVFVPSIHQNGVMTAFKAFMTYEHGSSLLFAEDFSQNNLPSGFQLEGSAEIRDSYVELNQGSSLSFPSLDNKHGGIQLKVNFIESPEKISQRLKIVLPISGAEPIYILSDGRIQQGNSSLSASHLSSVSTIDLKIERLAAKLSIRTAVQSVVIPLSSDSALDIKLLSTNGFVKVDKVSAWRLPEQVM